MNTFAKIAIALIATTGLAAAQNAAKPAPPPAMPEMKPAKELADHAKMVSGSWKCTGETSEPSGQKIPMTGKLKVETTLDGFWLHTTFESKMGKMNYRFEQYDSVDAKSKRWKRVMVANDGMWTSGEGTQTGSKIEWELAAHTPMGDAAFREHEDYGDPKAGAKLSGEMSMDGGKNWLPVFSMACKK